jgi:hypothetical protein
MPVAVTLVDAGGFPITEVSYGLPMTPVASGGYPVTVVVSGGIPVTLVTDALAPYEDPETEVALTLTWTSGTSTMQPTFTLSGIILTGDVVTLSIYSDSGLTTLVDSDANTVDGAEQTAGTLSFPGLGALSDGTYWAVATLTATGRSGTSNTETKTLAAFDPLDLFGGGEKGFWFDASDLSTMFQDTAGSTPVTADGQTVKRLVDKSGNGYVLTEATNGPVYRTSGGKHWLEYNGTNSELTNTSTNVTNSIGELTVFFAVNATTPAAEVFVFQARDNSFTGRAALSITSAGHPVIWASRVDGAASTTLSGLASKTGADKIIVGLIDYNNNDASIYDGSTSLNSTTTMPSTAGVTGSTNGPLGLGVNGPGNGNYYSGRIYQALIINRLLTAGEKADLGAYMATKSGATY